MRREDEEEMKMARRLDEREKIKGERAQGEKHRGEELNSKKKEIQNGGTKKRAPFGELRK